MRVVASRKCKYFLLLSSLKQTLPMSAIIIKSDEKSNKLLKELAKQLGADVVTLKDDQYEDFILGNIIDSEKTGKDASRSDVFRRFKKK